MLVRIEKKKKIETNEYKKKMRKVKTTENYDLC